MKRIALPIIFLVFVASGTGAFAFFGLTRGLPQVDFLRDEKIPDGTRVYSDDDQLIGQFKVEKGIFVPLKSIPKDLINAVLAAEDSRFYNHKGLDYLGIARALFKDIIAMEIKEGGSTITQQLAKVLFLTPEKTIKRKIKEAVLAIRIEKSLSKDQILEHYLNKIYFGHGAYGVEMASKTYFGKSVQRLTLGESAMLAGLIKTPAMYSPYNNLQNARYSQFRVLKRMEEEGFISKEEVEKAWKQPIYLSSLREKENNVPYFLEYIRQYLETKYGTEMVYKGGLRLYTTLNRRMQVAAVRALQEGLREIDKRRGWRGPITHKEIDPKIKEPRDGEAIFRPVVMTPGDIFNATVIKVTSQYAIVKARGLKGRIGIEDMRWASRRIEGTKVKEIKSAKASDILKVGDVVKVRLKMIKGQEATFALEQDPLIEGAIVAIEVPTGFIRAMVGGYDYQRSEFNRAVQARRQPGSAFKPIIYTAAMDYGYTPASIILDEPVTYDETLLSPGWSPENYDGKYWGPTRLREALIYSRNVVTVKLLEGMGINPVVDLATRLGLKGPFPHDLTLALGSLSITPLELTAAYGVFANGGKRMDPIAIKYITTSIGELIENNEPRGEEAISPETAFLITSMMEDVVRYGTGWRAKALGRPVAGKTGTTNDYVDAWFLGYTPQLVAGVWVGFDGMESLGRQETGARAASPIWVSFMNEALKDEPPEDFFIPEGITMIDIDPETGLLAQSEEAIIEFFKKGTAPRVYAPYRIGQQKTERPLTLDID